MASKTATATAERPTTSGGRKLAHRPVPFVALLLTVPVALAAGLILHYLVRGGVGRAITPAAIITGTILLAGVAVQIGEKRRPIVRWHVVGTVIVTGYAEALTVAIGMPRWWALTFAVGGLFVACSWALYRIDALRSNPNQAETGPDPLTKKLGLENTGFGRPQRHYDADGELARIEVPVKHGPGETAEVIQGAVAGIESAADQALRQPVPRGRSRAVPTDGAGESRLVIITKDLLANTIPWRGPSAPGACITAPLVSGLHEDQQFVQKYIAGGHPHCPNPSSYGYMGMTRTGKTLNAQINAMEMMTRRWVQIFWFDTIKGAQTVAPMRDGLDIIVASDDPAAFRKGMKALARLVIWRAQRLGECGYRAWTPQAAADPRLKMPLIVAHFEEADALCDIAADDMVFLASKGLSTGIVEGVSLQRADANSIPTGLRFNIGDWSVFGCGDEYSAGFALSDATIAAGAHPEHWKQSKPGYFYHEGPGVPEQLWPVTARSFFAEDEQIRDHVAEWAPRMDPLDQGSVAALGDWYTQIKDQMAAADAAGRNEGTGVTSTNNARAAGFTAADGDPDAAEKIAARQEVAEEIAQMRASGEIPAQLDDEAEAIDPTKPVPPPAPGDELTWDDGKTVAPDEQAAVEAFDIALRQIAADRTLRDPDHPTTVVFQVGTLVARYKFRSRPWFSKRLSDCADGRVTVPPGLVMSRTEKTGHYRLSALDGPDADGNTE